MPEIILKKGREKSLARRHPWVFSGAIEEGKGEHSLDPHNFVVDVFASSGEWLGRGLHSAASQIRVRILTFNRNEKIDESFFRHRVATAWRARENIWNPETRNAVRWVHGESDGLPGLVIDRYADIVSIQILTAGMDEFRDEIAAAILAVAPDVMVYERSDTPSRKLEGLPDITGEYGVRQTGAAFSPHSTSRVVHAHGVSWEVDVAYGHKTGCYLDQVENWTSIGARARGRTVLDTFCHHGGFAMHCLKNGAEKVLAVDSSADALVRAAENLALNKLDSSRCEFQCKDVFAALREYRDRAMSFDMIILDPPKFADSKGHVEKACRAYKDINMLAFKLLRPGGLLATFSCSGAVGPDLFQKVVADAALDAGRDAKILSHHFQPPDHPVALAFPEGLYLKGLLCEIVNY